MCIANAWDGVLQAFDGVYILRLSDEEARPATTTKTFTISRE